MIPQYPFTPKIKTARVCWLAVWTMLLAHGALDAAEEPAPLPTSVTLSVRDFGAKGDATTDDSPAFQRALERAAAAEHALLRIPAGVYRLAQQVKVQFKGAVGNGLAIVGDGQGVSVLHCANPQGGLKIRSELCQSQVTLRDFTLLATLPDAGTALEVSSSVRGVRNYRTLLVQNVDMRGQGLPTHNYFSRGLCAMAQWRPLFQNVVFAGILDPALKETDLAHDALRHKPEYGIAADWSYAPSFQHCYAWSCHTGYRVVSRELRPEGPEDGAFYRCTAVGTRVGIDIDTPTIEPQLVIDACHLNCREVGVRLRNRKFFHIVNCLLYSGSEDQRPYTDLSIENCWAGLISGNAFHSPHPENQKPNPPSQRTCIAVNGKSRGILITANAFNGKGLTLRLEAGATGIEATNNQYLNPHVVKPQGKIDGGAVKP